MLRNNQNDNRDWSWSLLLFVLQGSLWQSAHGTLVDMGENLDYKFL